MFTGSLTGKARQVYLHSTILTQGNSQQKKSMKTSRKKTLKKNSEIGKQAKIEQV